MTNCHKIQGRLCDISMLIGASVGPCPSLAVRKRLFKIYRYINLAHAVTFKSVSPTLSHLSFETDFVDKLGLLTRKEAEDLMSADNMPREHVFTWLAAEVQLLFRMENVMPQHTGLQIADRMARLRANCVWHHGMSFCFYQLCDPCFTILICAFNFFLRSVCHRQPESLRVSHDDCGQLYAIPLYCCIPILVDRKNS